MVSRQAEELMSFVDSGQLVPEEFRGRLCRGDVFDELANAMPEAWLRTRLAAGVCGLTGSKISPWLLLPTNRTSAAWLLVHMCGDTDAGRCLAAAMSFGRGNESAVAREITAGLYGEIPDIVEVLRKMATCDAEEFIRVKLNKKQIPVIPPERIEVMVKGAEKLKRRCRAVLESLETTSTSSNRRLSTNPTARATSFSERVGGGEPKVKPDADADAETETETERKEKKHGGTGKQIMYLKIAFVAAVVLFASLAIALAIRKRRSDSSKTESVEDKIAIQQNSLG